MSSKGEEIDGQAPEDPENAEGASDEQGDATESETEAMDVDATENAPRGEQDQDEEEGGEDEEEDQPTETPENAKETEVGDEQMAEEDAESSTKDDASESVARSSRSQTAADEPTHQTTYSTRGRFQKEEDPLEALLAGVRAQGEEEERMMTATASATSFLDALNEEDRRTRTRFLPAVDGFHPLYKNEVKSDLALARCVTTSAGQSSSIAKRGKGKKQKDTDQMNVDDGEGTGPSEDERAFESGSGKVVDYGNREFSVPSKVFVAPKSDGIDGVIPTVKPAKNQLKSPFVAEAITAYDPPRPPESTAAKTKHRMLRWERRPQDVDANISNYKKTVQRTREELYIAEKERERIQIFGGLMRIHYRDQLELLNEECHELNEELASIQTECVKAADLLTSRTRSRGAGKGSYLMRDVMAVLKQRGTELAEKGLPPPETTEEVTNVSGLGGVTSFGFIDWDKSTDVPVQKLAIGWTLPGDKVTTPYGDGVALHVFGPSMLDVDEELPIDLRPKPAPTAPTNEKKDTAADTAPCNENGTVETATETKVEDDGDVVMETESPAKEAEAAQETKKDGAAEDAGAVKPTESTSSPAAKADEENGKKTEGTSKSAPTKTPSSKPKVKKEKEIRMDKILAPRICVKLPFGVGFFPVAEVQSKENPALYSDAKLATRWNKMVETAMLVGSCLDVSGMESVARASVVDRDYKIQSSMEIDEDSEENASGTEAKVTSTQVLDKPKSRKTGAADVSVSAAERFVPYGANLLPTDAGRGSLIAQAPLTALEPQIQDVMFNAGGALGLVGLYFTLLYCSLNVLSSTCLTFLALFVL